MNFSDDELARLLSLEDADALQQLYSDAYRMKLRSIGPKVSLRGLIEFSNRCVKDCRYCGIRRSNRALKRFRLTPDEILSAAQFAMDNHFASLVLQSGEIESPQFTDFVETALNDIMELSSGKLSVTLSCGEQTEQVYRRWKNAGARRYLLRIESATEELYRKLHPPRHSFTRRVECLKIIRSLGFQLGTGVMTGIPGQTAEHLVRDLRFFQEIDADMLGMGPYIPHPDTPMGRPLMPLSSQYRRRQLTSGLKMIACARLLLENVNIASTTALQALDPDGRKRGLLAGANVLMPNITDVSHRKEYQLYDGKPALDESAADSLENLEESVRSIGEELLFDQYGDSPHFTER